MSDSLNPLDAIDVHPALAAFPLPDEAAITALAEDLARNGQREPLLATEDGYLLDGRARYIAIKRIGQNLAPVVKVVSVEDPFGFVIGHKRDYIAGLSKSGLAFLGARLARTPPGRNSAAVAARHRGMLATTNEVVELLGLESDHSINMARRVLAEARDPGLVELAESGQVPIFTVRRVCGLPEEGQREYLTRVREGANPMRAAPREGSGLISARSAYRHGVVTQAAIQRVTDSLAAIQIVVEGTTGLDPAITPELAEQLYRDLSRAHRGYALLSAMLRDRKGQQ